MAKQRLERGEKKKGERGGEEEEVQMGRDLMLARYSLVSVGSP